MEKGLGQLCLWGRGRCVKIPFSPVGGPCLRLPLTCSPWVVRRGWAPRLAVVVGVIFLTKPPLRPLLPDTHAASSLRSSPASGKTKYLVPKPSPRDTLTKSILNLRICGEKRPRLLGSAQEHTHIRLLGTPEGTGHGLRTGGGGGGDEILTDIRTASVEQVLVHHRHAILGERAGQNWDNQVQKSHKSPVSILACLLYSCGPYGSGWTPTLTKPCSEVSVSISNTST